MNKVEIMNEYVLQLDNYERYQTFLIEEIESNLKNERIKYKPIKSRIKDKDSLYEKIDRKKYTDFSKITDILWVRIITFFQEDIDLIHNIIKRSHNISFYDSIDKRKASVSEFWYQSLHLILKWSWEFNGLYAEIQIRTILQDAWAEIEHGIWYKSTFWIPYQIKRSFSRISGMLEMCDREFSYINKNKWDFEIDPEYDLSHVINLEFNEHNLKKYIQENRVLKFIDKEITTYYWSSEELSDDINLNNEIFRLKYFWITDFQTLTSLLIDNKRAIIEISKKLINIPKWKTPMGIAFYYLWYVLVAKKDITEIYTYLKDHTHIRETDIVASKIKEFSSNLEFD